MLRKILKFAGLGALLATAVGAWFFANPAPPADPPVYAANMLPAEGNSGVFEAGGRPWLLLPSLDGGLSRFALDEVGRGETDGGGTPQFSTAQPYRVHDISIERDVAFSAWLIQPEQPGKAAIVILHGSGNSDRANGYYIALADRLARAGYTVLLPDKRGSGRSGGDWRNQPLTDLAGDGAAWLAALRDAVDAPAYGFVGVSQGGSIAPEAARLAEADFVVSIGSSATDYNRQLRHEVGNDVAAAGVPGWLADPLADLYTWRAKRRQPGFWEANGTYATLDRWLEWQGPWFAAYGSLDESDNVPVSESMELLAAAQGEGPLSYRLYEGATHGIVGADGDFADGFLGDVGAFIDANTPSPD